MVEQNECNFSYEYRFWDEEEYGKDRFRDTETEELQREYYSSVL